MKCRHIPTKLESRLKKIIPQTQVQPNDEFLFCERSLARKYIYFFVWCALIRNFLKEYLTEL